MVLRMCKLNVVLCSTWIQAIYLAIILRILGILVHGYKQFTHLLLK